MHGRELTYYGNQSLFLRWIYFIILIALSLSILLNE